jgi:hypothetical protein
MKLADWIKVKGLKSKWVAAQLQVTPQTLSMYCQGRRVPTPVVMERIIRLTEAMVEPNDFYDIRAIRAAREGAGTTGAEGAAA